MPPGWVTDESAALLTDLYQLTMLQAYAEEGLEDEALFDLFVRRIPGRNYLVACGLDTVLHYLETLHFTPEALDYLASLGLFRAGFLDRLSRFRFEGDVYAVPEGTPIFPTEPILHVVAPIAQAQLVETFLLNQITFQTGIASKAARVMQAAAGRTVVDFGLRRMHGTDAGMKAARAAYIAGADATSNVLAGQHYGIPVTGTMAHSYVEVHDLEVDAFEAFVRLYPGTTLLVDTYDTLPSVHHIVKLSRERGGAFKVGAIRLDSGDMAELARQARAILDQGGLHDVRIFASGSLDEHAVAELVARGAPIDGFGVGTKLGTMADRPYLDSVYKLSEYAGRPRMKLSPGKSTLPGRKQVFRFFEQGKAVRDVIACADEEPGGTPLLQQVMHRGKRTAAGRVSLQEARRHARTSRESVPDRLLSLKECDTPYPVDISSKLRARQEQARRDLEERMLK